MEVEEEKQNSHMDLMTEDELYLIKKEEEEMEDSLCYLHSLSMNF